MDGSRELDVLLQALRTGAIDPHRLVEAAAAWPDGRPGFVAELLDRGLLDRQKLHAGGSATASFGAGEGTGDWSDPRRTTPSFGPVAETPERATASFAPGGPAVSTREQTPSAEPPAVDWDPVLAARFPGYTVLGELGEGGMGVVYKARQTSLDRIVALKVIKSPGPGARGRFLREAQVTGRLEHPGIVPIYDLADPPDDRPPYYAMRFVAGRTLAQAVGQYHRDRAAGRATRLDLIALLDALVAVCHAVAFAHSRNVLHRDLKGQNVVLGDYGEVFLLDWGLAKEADQVDTPAGGAMPTPADRRGEIAGTPAFMAPEVAAGGRATRASDVYALGAILYTILAGRLPYDGATPDEVLSKVTAAQPPPPRAVNPAAPAALEAVCRKAMNRDPQARYATAEELATEVRRWLADEPVRAFRDPWTVRATRWARRHRTPVAAAVVFLVTAVVGLSVGAALLWVEKDRTAEQKRHAEREWARAEEAHDRAEKERTRAEGNFATARTLAVDLGRRIDALETGLPDSTRTDRERKAALDAARDAFENFRGELPGDLQIQVQAAALHHYAANVARLLGDFPAAEKAYVASIAIWADLAGKFPGHADYRDKLALALADLAALQKRQGRLRDAAATVGRAAELAEGLEGVVPDSHYRRTLGVILLGQADIEHRLGNAAAAEPSARRAAELLGGLADAPLGEVKPIDPLLVVIAIHTRAVALRGAGRTADALQAHEETVARLERLGGARGSRDVRHYLNKARAERAATWAGVPELRGRAIDDLGAVIADAEKLAAEHPHVPYYPEAWVAAYLLRGELHAAAGRLERAEADLTKGLGIARDMVQQFGGMPDHRGLGGRIYLALARVAAGRGKPAEVAAHLAGAVRALERALAADPDNDQHRRALEEARREHGKTKP